MNLLHPACLVFFALALGCSNGPRSAVSGTVYYDGAKVTHGAVVFVAPNDVEADRATAKIIDGHYHLDSYHGPKPGKYRIEIYWQKKSGNKVPGEGDRPRNEIVSAIPAKYNTESELTAEVHPGSNTLNYDLKK